MPSSVAPLNATPAKTLTLAANASFVPIGFVTVLLSPLLPTLSARWALDYTQAGALFTAQFLGSTVAVGLSGVLASRFGFRFAINAGLALIAACVAIMLLGPRILGIACIAGYGAGSGLAVPAANLLVAKLNPRRGSSALNVLNFAWSAGAVACPFLVAAAERSHRLFLLLVCVAGFALLMAIWIAAMPSAAAEPVTYDLARPANVRVNWRRRSLFPLLALFFLYVGSESAFGGWLASYATSLGTMRAAVAVMTPSFFYGSLMVARLVAPALLRKLHDVRLAKSGLLLACAGIAGLTLSHHLPGILLSASAAGFGLASVYPITISFLPREFGAAASQVGSVAFMLSNLGGACLPWLVGLLSTRLGAIQSGLVIPLMGTAAMFVLYLPNWQSSSAESV